MMRPALLTLAIEGGKSCVASFGAAEKLRLDKAIGRHHNFLHQLLPRQLDTIMQVTGGMTST
jgi:hypothetical protein